MPKKKCEMLGRGHSDNGDAVARIELSWFSRATEKQETDQVDVCTAHLEVKRREFGPNPEPNMFGPPLAPKFKIIKVY